jgi:precorrin-6A/cobalt-precorrin-6A reductase
VSAFAEVASCWFLIRSIGAPEPPLPPHHGLLLARGPFALDDELALFDQYRIDAIVTKDSGGAPTEAKLEAARRLRLPVVVVERPRRSDALTVPSVDAAARWVRALLGGVAITAE